MPAPTFFSRPTPGGRRNLLDTLRGERTGGVLLLIGALVGLVLANGPTGRAFADLKGHHLAIGPIDLSVAHWAGEGLLTVFFFVIGLELIREIRVGELRRASTAVVPVVGAVGGMLVPAAIYLAVNLTAPDGAPEGWAIPTATDIAFAVAVLGLVGRGLPLAVRAFLLTLAVVDDLFAILVIAFVFSSGIAWASLALAVAAVVAFAVLVRTQLAGTWARWPVLGTLAVVAWAATLEAGLHATLAGVALGLCVPAVRQPWQRAKTAPAVGRDAQLPADDGLQDAEPDDGRDSLAEQLEHRWRPVSAGLAVPLFALVTAGVVIDPGLLAATAVDPVAWGVVLGLVVGKPLGITGATWLLVRFTRASLAPGVAWPDIAAVACLGGIGFTVSLLVGELALGDSPRSAEVVIAVLVASLAAALLGALALGLRRRSAAGA